MLSEGGNRWFNWYIELNDYAEPDDAGSQGDLILGCGPLMLRLMLFPQRTRHGPCGKYLRVKRGRDVHGYYFDLQYYRLWLKIEWDTSGRWREDN